MTDSTERARQFAAKWSAGIKAFERGEIPPADPDEADGWYWAENNQGKFRERSNI